MPVAIPSIYSIKNLKNPVSANRVVELVEVEKVGFDDYYQNAEPTPEKIAKATKRGGFLCCAPPLKFIHI